MGLVFVGRRLLRQRRDLKRAVGVLRRKVAEREREEEEFSRRKEEEYWRERAFVRAMEELNFGGEKEGEGEMGKEEGIDEEGMDGEDEENIDVKGKGKERAE